MRGLLYFHHGLLMMAAAAILMAFVTIETLSQPVIIEQCMPLNALHCFDDMTLHADFI